MIASRYIFSSKNTSIAIGAASRYVFSSNITPIGSNNNALQRRLASTVTKKGKTTAQKGKKNTKTVNNDVGTTMGSLDMMKRLDSTVAKIVQAANNNVGKTTKNVAAKNNNKGTKNGGTSANNGSIIGNCFEYLTKTVFGGEKSPSNKKKPDPVRKYYRQFVLYHVAVSCGDFVAVGVLVLFLCETV